MAFTTADLAAVDAAIASGELSVDAGNGKRVTYRSMSELMNARRAIQSDLAAQQAATAGTCRSPFVRATFGTHRGF